MSCIRDEIETSALDAAEISASGIERSGNARRRFCFAPEFTGFSGHFPGMPILPAMLQTMMAQMLAEQVLPAGAALVGVKRAKFAQQLGPATTIEVELAWRYTLGQWICNATLRAQEQEASSMTLIFEEKAV
jgi:3-hydroxyacyl-[acyl-carrier-protein] dehydratase